jgi:hypothetical protein
LPRIATAKISPIYGVTKKNRPESMVFQVAESAEAVTKGISKVVACPMAKITIPKIKRSFDIILPTLDYA